MRRSPTTGPAARQTSSRLGIRGGPLAGRDRFYPRWDLRSPRVRGTATMASSSPSTIPTRQSRYVSREFIESARRRLLQQRRFRVQQLAQLEAAPPHRGADIARAEIRQALRTAAQAALGNIDAALDSIDKGQYGRCSACGVGLSLSRLSALPMAPRCGACQHARDTRALVATGTKQTP